MLPSDPYSLLAARIRMGFYVSGSRFPSERDLALELGVHRNTIRDAVARLCAEGLLARKPHHRPIVQQAPDSPEGWRMVALLMGNEAPFKPFNDVIRGCEAVLRESHYRLVFMDTWGHSAAATRERERTALMSLLEHPVAGIILWCQDPDASCDLIAQVQQGGVPIVAIDRRLPGLDLDFVGIDNARAAQSAVDHLVALGHHRIGFVTGIDETISASLDREAGYRAALLRHGLSREGCRTYHVAAERAAEATQETARRIAADPERPSAVFVLNDFYALHLVRALRGAGLAVPQDIAVVGFDDIEHHVFGAPILTTVRQPFEDIGRHAAMLLLERLKARTRPIHHVLLDTALIPRSSTVSGSTLPGASSGAGAPAEVPAALEV